MHPLLPRYFSNTTRSIYSSRIPARRCPGTAPNISGSRDAGTPRNPFSASLQEEEGGRGRAAPLLLPLPLPTQQRTTVAFLDGQMGNSSRGRALWPAAPPTTPAPHKTQGYSRWERMQNEPGRVHSTFLRSKCGIHPLAFIFIDTVPNVCFRENRSCTTDARQTVPGACSTSKVCEMTLSRNMVHKDSTIFWQISPTMEKKTAVFYGGVGVGFSSQEGDKAEAALIWIRYRLLLRLFDHLQIWPMPLC